MGSGLSGFYLARCRWLAPRSHFYTTTHMATGKKSFILYCDLIHTVENMTDNEAGLLIKHILRYVNDKEPTCEDRFVNLAFAGIKQQLKRDLDLWVEEVEEKRTGGRIGNLKRWHPEIYKQYIKGKLTLEDAENKAKEVKLSHTDKNNRTPIAPNRIPSDMVASIAVNVNVNDTVSDNENLNTEIPYQLAVDFWLKEFKIGWTFSATHGKSLKALLGKLKKLIPEPSTENILDAFKVFCHKLPDWYKDKDLQVLNSKFNEIVTQIKNNHGTTKTKSAFAKY